MKRILSVAVLGLALLAFVPAALAYVNLTGYYYNRANGDFTLTVATSEPWVVWKTYDFENWIQVSPVMGVGRKSYTDTGVGITKPWAFYVVAPKGKHPNNGNHYGWNQPNNPHSD